MEELDLVFEPFLGDSLGRFLFENIANFNIGRTGIDSWHPVGYFLKNRRGEWLAGLTGHVWGGWLHVNLLWVTESLRGQRHGSRLMDAAEGFAAERGCHGVTLETHSFQASVSMRSAVWRPHMGDLKQMSPIPPSGLSAAPPL